MDFEPNIIRINHKQADISMLRLDLMDKFVSGNKWFKLKYNMEAARVQGQKTVLTFGGAYSNHIYATAASAKANGLRSIGIIRGEETTPLNPTLSFAASQGMVLSYITRSEYREKYNNEVLDKLRHKFGDFYLIPEGGTNGLAVKGMAEVVNRIAEDYDLWVLPVGTGGSMAGIISGLKGASEVLGFSALKGAFGLENDVQNLLQEYGSQSIGQWKINHDYHFGGYAKFPKELYGFITAFKREQGIILDPVYTSKMMFGVMDMLKKGLIPSDIRILTIHTGGLQGWNGMISRHGFIDGSFSFH